MTKQQWTWQQRFSRWMVLVGGSTFILGDCDPTIQTTVEDGIINTTSAFIGAFFQAALEVALNTTA